MKINKSLLVAVGLVLVAASTVVAQIPTTATPTVIVSTSAEPVANGRFQPTWESLKQYQTPEWFRDAKFGIWAHWGSQCQPERGDWYAREMYSEGNFKPLL
jgi:alpha-L-fucosidase